MLARLVRRRRRRAAQHALRRRGATRRRLRVAARRSTRRSSTATPAGFEHGEPRRCSRATTRPVRRSPARRGWTAGVDDGRTPIWPITSLGDTGNGFLSAIGILQALYHRDRTGEGQFVDTSIVYAQLLNASTAWVSSDGSVVGRPSPRSTPPSSACRRCTACTGRATDAGWPSPPTRGRSSPRCVTSSAVMIWRPRRHFAPPVVDPTATPRCRRARGRVRDEAGGGVARRRSTAPGYPPRSPTTSTCSRLFDDPEMIEKGWVTSYEHPTIGRMDSFGTSSTCRRRRARCGARPLVPGQDTTAILDELGYTERRDRRPAQRRRRGPVHAETLTVRSPQVVRWRSRSGCGARRTR